MRKYTPIWLHFLEAFEAGLWVFWILPDSVVAVPRPEIHAEEGRLHRRDGPAIVWPEGSGGWYWKGVRVPRHVVEDPSSITSREILDETNVEVRRVMLERLGMRRFLEACNVRGLDADSFGTLYRVELPQGEPLVIVRVMNSTPEPDGSSKEYFLRVPPGTGTAREAVAWTFGLDEQEYAPQVET
ncbi:MAG: hypothetical protein L0170_09090 [Acidobacteria bacterium]|nr:hypothetical protein [Acidobacteriota bacterium]